MVSTNTCRGLSLVIFDDEADAASLNTLVNKRRVSTINRNLQAIKESSSASIYIQVTATPQAIILQGEESGWKPAFVTYFKPGSKYLGGNFFYSNPPSYCAKFTDDDEVDNVVSDFIDGGACPRGLHDSIVTFLMNCAHKRINGENNCNFMIHPSVRISTHNAFVNSEILSVAGSATVVVVDGKMDGDAVSIKVKAASGQILLPAYDEIHLPIIQMILI